jgi:iron complex transport system ATP-binding protein
MTAGLEARGLSVDRSGRRILSEATAAIVPLALTAIVGPNGSGKSTLLRAMAGLWPVTAGSVTLDGEPIAVMPRRVVARRLAFMPQDSRCDFAFTVEEVVAMGRHPHRGRFEPERDADRRAVAAAIATCDLDDLRDRTVDHLSGGERQRVAIARCLAAEPDVILLDEPTAHLDLEHALTLLALCQSLAHAGRAVAVATHDLGTVSQFATRMLILNGGRVVADGAPDDVLTIETTRAVFGVDLETASTPEGRRVRVFSKR